MNFGTIKSIIFIWSLTTSLVRSKTFTFKTIGVYSECQGDKTNRTELSDIAKAIRGFVDLSTIPSERCNFDVCYDWTLFLSLVIDLILDEEYFIQEDNKPYKISDIAAIFTYIPDEMNQLLKHIMYDIPIYDSKYEEALDVVRAGLGT